MKNDGLRLIRELDELVQSLGKATKKPIQRDDYQVVVQLEAATKSPKLPNGKMAIYMFYRESENVFYKIGKAGPNSKARYDSQHYGFGAPSTLAKSLINDTDLVKIEKLTSDNVKEWMLNNLVRIDILLDSSLSVRALDMIEGALLYKYNPKYEGGTIFSEQSTNKANVETRSVGGKSDFELVWDNITNLQGHIFKTVRGLPFKYRIVGNAVVPDRTDYPLAKKQFEEAFTRMPLSKPVELQDLRGPSYIFAILTDNRINVFNKE